MIITRVDLLRHGNCEGGQIYRGRTDSPLTEAGQAQMQAACAGQQWGRVYTSPLQRCHSFAAQVAQQQDIPLVIDQRLIELDFGDWDGQSLEQVWSQQQQAVMQFWQDPEAHPPPNGERLALMAERVASCFADISRQAESSQVLVVTHGGVIRLLLSQLLAVPLQRVRQFSIDYGSLTRVEYYAGEDQSEAASEVIFSNRLPTLNDYV